MPTAELPADGYKTTNKMQTQAGWWCLEIECAVTDSAENVFTREVYINTGVQARETAPKITEGLIKACGDKLQAIMEYEVSDEARGIAVAEKQEEIDVLLVEKAKIVGKKFGTMDGVVGVRKT